jgi:hypothetical protein
MSESSPDKPFKWSYARQARSKELIELLKTPAFKEVFNDKFIDGLERRKESLEGRFLKVQAVQIVILLCLGISVLSVHLTVSLFGVSTGDAKNVREILLIISSSVQLINIFNVINESYIRDFLSAYVQNLSKGNEIALKALQMRYGLGFGLAAPKIEGAKLNWRHVFVVVAAGIGLFGWLTIAFVCAILIQIAAMIGILEDPTISLKFSIFVIIYVILVDCATFGIHIFGGGFSANVNGPGSTL